MELHGPAAAWHPASSPGWARTSRPRRPALLTAARAALYDTFHPHYRGLSEATRETAHFLADQQRRADR